MYKPEGNVIIFFEPEDYLFSIVSKFIGDDSQIFHAYDAATFASIIEKEENSVTFVIASDETEQYDTLEIMKSYKNEQWFAGALSLIVAKEYNPIREEKADEIGIQDYINLSTVSSIEYEKILKYCISRDFRLMRKLQRLKTLANCDGLTGFYNHATAPDIITKMLQKNPEQEFLFAIIDIDYFKQVNDVRGHEFGDKVLKEEAERIKEILSEQSLAIRYGGDEFVLMVPIVFDSTEIAQTIYETIHFMLDGYQITNSIGITTTLSCDREWEFLFRQADQALFTAKANGRNQYCIYTAEMSGKLDGVGNEVRNETLNLGTSSLIHALVNGYSVVYHLDLDKVAVTKLTKIASGEYGWSDPVEYIPFIKNTLELVENKNKLRFSEFINPNTLSGRLKTSPTLTYIFTGVDGKEYYVEYLAGDKNQRGQITNALMLLGETNNAKNKNGVLQDDVTDVEKCLASSLTNTYNAIWIIHPTTLSRELVSIQTDISRHRRINRLFEGGNFWEETQGYVLLYVSEDERESLLKALHPDVLFNEVYEQGMYTLHFHRKVDGITHYCEYSFTSAMYGDEKVIVQLYRRLEQVE